MPARGAAVCYRAPRALVRENGAVERSQLATARGRWRHPRSGVRVARPTAAERETAEAEPAPDRDEPNETVRNIPRWQAAG